MKPIKYITKKVSEWIEDSLHWLKTGESTLRCFDGDEWHKVYLNAFGGSRVDPSDFLRSRRVREEMEAMSRIAQKEMKRKAEWRSQCE